MPRLVRVVRPSRWYRERAVSLLDQGDVPSDCLGDLSTVDSRLSVFALEDDGRNLEAIVAAQASTRLKPDDAGYIVFDSAILGTVGIVLEHSPATGRTPDREANSRHHDLVGLSGSGLVRLARELFLRGEIPRTLLRDDVIRVLREGVAEGRVDSNRMSKGVRDVVTGN